jgi:hypothetical protein
MKFDLTMEEAALVLDALSALPLQRSYNLFNKLGQQVQAEQNSRGKSVPESVVTTVPSDISCKEMQS